MIFHQILFLCLLSLVKTQTFDYDYPDDHEYQEYLDRDSLIPPEIQENYEEARAPLDEEAPAPLDEWFMNHLVEVVMLATIVLLSSVVLTLLCCFAELKRMVIDNRNNNMEMQTV